MLNQLLELARDHETLLWWAGSLSILTFLGTLVLVPILIVRLPEDYFVRTKREPGMTDSQHPALRMVLLMLKNGFGVLFVLTGLALIFLPGQGVITILIGITLLDFPGKYRLERWIICRRPVNRAVNWMRAKAHHRPLQIPDSEHSNA